MGDYSPIINAYGNNLANGNVLYTNRTIGGNDGLFGSSLFASPQQQMFGLNSDGINFLKDKGFNADMLGDSGFTNYVFQKGGFSTTNNGGLNINLSPDQLKQAYADYNAGIANKTINNNGFSNNSGNSLFGFGKDANGNTTFAGGTGLQWLGGAAQLGMGLWGAYQQNKQLKLAQQAFEEQRALQRANFKMQAKSYNNSLRNQQSGRGYVGMSGSAVRTLGRDYDSRKADETY